MKKETAEERIKRIKKQIKSTEYPIKIEEGFILIDSKKMVVGVTYNFKNEGDDYATWKDFDDVIIINEIFRRKL